MSREFTMQKYIRIYDDQEGAFLEVGCAPDGPEFGIAITTAGDKLSEEWYGKQSLTIGSKKQAEMIARAILEISADMPDEP